MKQKIEIRVEKNNWHALWEITESYQAQGWHLAGTRRDRETNIFYLTFVRSTEQLASQTLHSQPA